MGMDVMGKNPTDDAGEYFRNNVWWWHPLWNYCCDVLPDVCEKVEEGHSNSGDGLDAEDSIRLADALEEAIRSGHTKEYETAYREHLGSLPREACSLCDETGIRRDEVGVQYGYHDKKLTPEQVSLYGREFGWCNGCDGHGSQANFMSNYPFDVSNVDEFAQFLRHCGGFQIF
jgi:hypothetical protein